MKWKIPAAFSGVMAKEKTVIRFDNEKRRKMGFLQIVFVAAALAGVGVVIFSESVSIRRALLGLFLCFGALLRQYIKTLDKENAR
jgi:hypothetical protein